MSKPARVCAVTLLTAFILLLAACGGSPAPAPGTPGQRGGGGGADRQLPVRAYTVARRTLEREVLVAGTVEPLRSIELAARTDGVVERVRVEAGDRVRAGQLLATIDVREQQAELARAEAALTEARTNFERLDALRDRNFVDQASVVRAKAALEVAETDVNLWKTRIDFGRIEASIDGVVIERRIEPGAAVGRLAPAFELADLDQLVLRLGVSELDAAGITVGAEVTVAVDALAEAPVEAQVRRVFPSADRTSRLVTVELALPGAYAQGVRPGFLARARFRVDRRREVIAVPAAAVAATAEPYVLLINAEQKLERRPVRLGIVQGEWREIVEGLTDGEQIIATSPLDLSAGDAVRVVETVGAR
ncbi:MAG: efflux RND transporter periplasmic adaptor subunit [Xanthomonadales bacterium]|jgi:RND family efflux transporter MFP subunit|nr:efflux RND transporter periplasmic adaptor subunit [Xanthomonadales bacterium]